eukprot:s1434_g16.t1
MFPTTDGTPASKTGWADTFEILGKTLQLPCTYPNGARCFTGHTARATGAVHMASNQVELWRIQLFGRWGSQVFLHYIRDAPLKQLDKLALETSAQMSIEAAKSQLQDLLRRAKTGLASVIACPSQEMIDDCETAAPQLEPPRPTDVNILNTNGGKVHRTLVFGDAFHPREWKTRCSWHFGGPHTTYEVLEGAPSASEACRKCFPELRHQAPVEQVPKPIPSQGPRSSAAALVKHPLLSRRQVMVKSILIEGESFWWNFSDRAVAF